MVKKADTGVFSFPTCTYALRGICLLYTSLAPESFAIVIGDRIFIPATKIFELLGAEIVWNSHVQQADVTAQNLHVTFGIGNENAAINGAPSALDVAPVIINEKAMVPAEFVEECFPVKAQLLENDIFSIARL